MIEIHARGLEAVEQSLHAILESDLDEALDELGDRMIARVRMGFRRSQDPYGEPWAKIFHRKGQPLLDTGVLQRSMDYDVSRGSLRLGSSLDYAPKHQLGLGVKKRAMLPDERGLPESWLKEILMVLRSTLGVAQ